MALKAVKHFKFEYEFVKYNVKYPKVEVAVIDLPNGNDFILISNISKTSFKTSDIFEELATQLVTSLGLIPDTTLWGEYYPLTRPEKINLVNMKWSTYKGILYQGIWERAPDWMEEYILESLKLPIVYQPLLQPDLPRHT